MSALLRRGGPNMAVPTFTDEQRAAAVISCMMVQNAPDISPSLTAALMTRRPSEILNDPALRRIAMAIFAGWQKLEKQRETRIRALCETGMTEIEAQEAFNLAVSQACISAAMKRGGSL